MKKKGYLDRVEIDAKGHWHWTGGPFVRIGSEIMRPARGAWRLFLADPPPEEKIIVAVCGTEGCVCPPHLGCYDREEWSRKTAPQRIRPFPKGAANPNWKGGVSLRKGVKEKRTDEKED